MERAELGDKKLRIFAVSTSTRPDMSTARIRTILVEEGAKVAKKLFHVLVMSAREPALAVIRGIEDMKGALAWRALVLRYAPNTAPRVQSLMNAILNATAFPSELAAYEIALDGWRENFLASVPRYQVRASMSR